MSDVATPKPEIEFVPRRLIDAAMHFLRLNRFLEDEPISVAVVKAFAKSVARDETIPNLDLVLLSPNDWMPYPECGVAGIDRLQLAVIDQGAAFLRMFSPKDAMTATFAELSPWAVVCFDEERDDFHPIVALSDWLIGIRQTDPRAYAKVLRMSFAAIWQAQERWHATLVKRGGAIDAPNLASCPVLHRYDDGWAWVWVRTDAERDAEGNALGHCVGQGAYDKHDGRAMAIVSLRDPQGKPHVTMEIYGIKRVQAMARANTPPGEKYRDRIKEATRRIGAAVHHHEPRWLDDDEAKEIVAEELSRSLRAAGVGAVSSSASARQVNALVHLMRA